MLKILNKRLKSLYSRLRCPILRRTKPKLIITQLRKANSKPPRIDLQLANGSSAVHPNTQSGHPEPEKHIRIATFNAALFSMASVIPKTEKLPVSDSENEESENGNRKFRSMSVGNRLKSILKPSPLHSNSMNGIETDSQASNQPKFPKSKLRVSINLPDNEISLLRNRKLSSVECEGTGRGDGDGDGDGEGRGEGDGDGDGKGENSSSSAPLKPNSSFLKRNDGFDSDRFMRSNKTVFEVLRELDADILGLQDVKADEEMEMKPLSDLASALGMNYAFAESWAPEYGNAVLSKWPIKRWSVQKIYDDTDFRNVLKATIDVPQIGEMEFHCTHLDHLDENWRMKQINCIIQSTNLPHILVGGLNSLDETDYSLQRWSDIVKYYEEIGKPTPKVEVMRFLKSREYTDAKDFAGECESVVMIAKGQSVQGTCKYGTRVDYIMASPNSTYKFVPGSYSVFSSKGTSDHHIVKVDVVKVNNNNNNNNNEKKRVKIIKKKEQ